jgi:DHA3 family macrolide efflux protein-like MFS transporter
VVNISNGFFSSLFTPMVLSLSNAQTLGVIVSTGGIGFLVGGALMSAWGGPKPGRRVSGVFVFLLGLGLAIALMGVSPAIPVIIAGLLMMNTIFPIVSGTSQAIWQTKVEADIQGRVFSVRSMVASFFQPLSYLMAGPLADKIFEPGMMPDGKLAISIGHLIGSGPGRGMGLLLLIMGTAVILATLIAFTNPRIRKLESEIPDAIQPESKPEVTN